MNAKTVSYRTVIIISIVEFALIFGVIAGCGSVLSNSDAAPISEELLMKVDGIGFSKTLYGVRVVDENYNTICYLNTRGGIYCAKLR